ncbi:MAG: hypothetical protein K2H36_05220, partial [Clostridia bacterium]|nr:hypothetical protein [Clostridia bacterium]
MIMCLCFVSAVTFFVPQNSANAVASGANTTDIGKILIDNYENKTKKFDAEQLDKLYAQITGVPNATYSDVVEAAKETRNSEYFYTKNNNKIITLTIDGIEWSAMYLSTNRSEEPILTLWQASSTQTAQWNYHSTNANAKYPSNMYGTSMIRTLTLNNGGTWYETNAGGTPHVEEQKPDNIYAKFTMSSVTGSLSKFIDEPIKVEWQESEKASSYNSYDYNFNNDSYSTTSPGSFYNKIDYLVPAGGATQEERNADYTAWKNDKIWLPSMTEAGWIESPYVARGLWKTRALERGNAGGINSWLRSQNDYFYYSTAVTLTTNGSNCDNPNTTAVYAVRPAFHLNLKEVEAASTRNFAEPKNISSAYNGEVQTLETLKSDLDWYNSAFADPSIVEVK